MKLFTKMKIATALALVMTATTTVADTITQQKYFGMGKDFLPDDYQQISFEQFDPSKGSLRLSVSIDSTIVYDPTKSGWTSLHVEVLTGGYPREIDFRNFTWNDSELPLNGNSMRFQFTRDVDDGYILSDFTGTGEKSVFVKYQLYQSETDNSTPYWYSSNFTGYVTLSYSYGPPPVNPPAAVPESGSIAFLGIGITGLAVYGRQRKKTAV
jgi:hypothetical protein